VSGRRLIRHSVDEPVHAHRRSERSTILPTDGSQEARQTAFAFMATTAHVAMSRIRNCYVHTSNPGSHIDIDLAEFIPDMEIAVYAT